MHGCTCAIKIPTISLFPTPTGLNPKKNPYFHQISLDCIEKLVECIESTDIEEMDCDTCFKMQEILRGEIDDSEFLEFTVENISELFGYITTGRINIRVHRDIEGNMGSVRREVPNGVLSLLDVGRCLTPKLTCRCGALAEHHVDHCLVYRIHLTIALQLCNKWSAGSVLLGFE